MALFSAKIPSLSKMPYVKTRLSKSERIYSCCQRRVMLPLATNPTTLLKYQVASTPANKKRDHHKFWPCCSNHANHLNVITAMRVPIHFLELCSGFFWAGDWAIVSYRFAASRLRGVCLPIVPHITSIYFRHDENVSGDTLVTVSLKDRFAIEMQNIQDWYAFQS